MFIEYLWKETQKILVKVVVSKDRTKEDAGQEFKGELILTVDPLVPFEICVVFL